MTHRERTTAALQHKQTDYCPYQFELTIPLAEAVERVTGIADFPATAGCDVICAPYRHPGEWIEPGIYQDGFGVEWNRTGADKDIGMVQNRMIPEPDARLIQLPPVDEAQVHELFSQAVAGNKKQQFLFGRLGYCLFERAWSLCGMEELLTYMVLEPEFVHELMTQITERNLQVLQIAVQYPLDGFHFGDDWGQQRGLIMGPKHWRHFIKPYMARHYEIIRSAGMFCSQHSCGDLREVFGDCIDIGLQCYQTFQTEIYDIPTFKQGYGKHLSVWGGLSTQALLPFATPDELRVKVPEIMRTLGENGGLIAAPTHQMPADIPVENVLVLADIFQNQGRYI